MTLINYKYITYLVVCAGLLLTASACNDFLEEESQDEVIPKTTIDYRELLMGSGYYPQEEPTAFTYYMDDDVEFNTEYQEGAAIGTSAAIGPYPTFTWQPSFVDRNGNGEEVGENPASTPYAKYYVWIMGCNAVLDNIDGAIGTQQERDRVRAEALALRALYYFRLVNLYGEPYNENPQSLAVPLKLHSGIDEEYPARATVAEVYTQIVNDLTEATRLMEPLDIVRRDFHINQPAMHILLSRVYLYMEDWEACIAAANRVFEQGGRVADLIEYVADPIAPVNVYLSYDNPEVEWVYGGNPQVDQDLYMPSLELITSFDDNDKRKGYFSGNDRVNYYLVSKLRAGTELTQVLRTPEALLNRAEAYAQLKDVGNAAADLNLLRSTRIIEYTDESFDNPEEVLAAVRDERRKEFCYEGFRWFDLRRYGMPAIEHRYQHAAGEPMRTYTLEEKDPMYTLPFPNSLVLRNANLEQNPSAYMGERQGH